MSKIKTRLMANRNHKHHKHHKTINHKRLRWLVNKDGFHSKKKGNCSCISYVDIESLDMGKTHSALFSITIDT